MIFDHVTMLAARIVGATTDQMAMLMIAGAAGAYVRAVYAPERDCLRMFSQWIAGALSAVFLGHIVAELAIRLLGVGVVSASFAAGFLMGEGGLVTVHAIRALILKKAQP